MIKIISRFKRPICKNCTYLRDGFILPSIQIDNWCSNSESPNCFDEMLPGSNCDHFVMRGKKANILIRLFNNIMAARRKKWTINKGLMQGYPKTNSICESARRWSSNWGRSKTIWEWSGVLPRSIKRRAANLTRPKKKTRINLIK